MLRYRISKTAQYGIYASLALVVIAAAILLFPRAKKISVGEAGLSAAANAPTLPCGTDTSMGDTELDCGSGMSTGNFDMSIPLGGTGLTIFYNSNALNGGNGPFVSALSTKVGRGFRLSLDTAYYVEGTAGSLLLADGTEIRFGADGFPTDDRRRNMYWAAGTIRGENGSTMSFVPAPGNSKFYLLKSYADLNGRGYTITRDSYGAVSTVQFTQTPLKTTVTASGNVFVNGGTPDSQYNLVVDAEGYLTKIVTPVKSVNGVTLSWNLKYDRANKLLIEVVDPNGNAKTITYYPNSTATQAILEDGFQTKFTYGSGKVTMTEGENSLIEEFGGNGLVAMSTNNARTAFTRDSLKRATIEMDFLGKKTTYTYDGASHRVKTQTSAGVTTTNTYGMAPGGLFTKLMGVSSTVTGGITTTASLVWENDFKLKSVTAGGSTTSTTYDVKGNVTEVRDDGEIIFKATAAYGPFGTLTQSKDRDGIFTGKTYDMTYDSYGHLTQKVLPTGHTYNYTYDAYGRLSKAQLNGSYITSYTYDPMTGEIKTVTNTNSLNGAQEVNTYGLQYRDNGSVSQMTMNATMNGSQQVNVTKLFGDLPENKLSKVIQNGPMGQIVSYDASVAKDVPKVQDSPVPARP